MPYPFPSRVSVSVGPTSTVLIAPTLGYQGRVVALTNTDATQVLDCRLELSDSLDGPWAPTVWADLEGVQPLADRLVEISAPLACWRLVGTASGAGLTVSISSWGQP